MALLSFFLFGYDSYQQGFEIQHVLFAQDDEGSRATESVAAVGLQARHPAETALPVLATEDRGEETVRAACGRSGDTKGRGGGGFGRT